MSPERNEDLAFHGNPRNIQYTTKAARLLNQTEAGVARALSDEPENFLERQYGRLFIALDLDFTSDFYDVGAVLADTMEREFYADLNLTVGQSFERALTAVNQTLADLAAEGQAEWVGKLNAVILALADNEVHVTKVGNAEAFMVRGHSTTAITEGLGEDAGQTAKTFRDVASGSLEVGDKLVITTGELLKHLSTQDLRRILYLHPPARAIRKVADQLAGKDAGELAAIVVELTTIDLVSAETVSDEPNEIILSAPRRHFEKLQGFRPLQPDTPIGEFAEKAKKYWNKRARPTLERTTAQAAHRVRAWNAKRKGEAPPPPPPRPAPGTPETVRSEPTAERPERPIDRISQQARHGLGTVGRKAAEALRPLGARLSRLWHRSGIPRTGAWQRIARTVRPLTDRIAGIDFRRQLAGNRRILYRNLIFGIAAVLLLSLALSINAAQTRKAEAAVRDRIKKVEELQAKAEASYIFKDLPGARTQLAEAKQEADGLSREKVLKAEIAALQQSLGVSSDRINNVVAVPNQPLADFAQAAGRATLGTMALSGTTLYAVTGGGPLHSFSIPSREIKSGQAFPPDTGGVRSAATTSNGDVLFLTDKPTVLQLDTASGQVAPVEVGGGGSWEDGLAIDTLQQNAFILDQGRGQIWRHARTLSAFNKGEPYFDDAQDFGQAVDLVTGAQVYVLQRDGTILKYAAGAKQDFSLKSTPGPDDKIVEPSALSLNVANGSLFVADPRAKRVIEYAETGEYIRQFRNDAFAGVEDIAVDDKTNSLYVLAGNKIFQINLAG